MKNNKGFAPIVIVLVIIAILVVGGIAYYVGKNNSTPQNIGINNYPAVNQNSAVNNPTPTSSATTMPTSLTSFNGSKGMFSAQSYGLTDVKVFFFPSGSEVMQPKLLG